MTAMAKPEVRANEMAAQMSRTPSAVDVTNAVAHRYKPKPRARRDQVLIRLPFLPHWCLQLPRLPAADDSRLEESGLTY